MVRKLSAPCIIILALMLSFFGCAKKEPEEIKIGAIAPLTGDAAVYGSALKRGMDLAVEEINQRGGINGKKLSLIYEDSQGDPKVAVAAYNKLVNVDKVSTILGDMFSSTTLAIAPLAEKSKIVLVSPTASAEAVPNTGEYIFSIYPSDAYDGRFLANFVSNVLHRQNAAVIYVQADAMIVAKNEFRKTLEKLGGKVVHEEGYAPKTDDFRSILSKVKSGRPDIIFIPGYLEEIVKLLRQAKELLVRTQFITISTAFDSKLFELAGSAAEGVLMSAPFYDPASKQPEVLAFQDSFKARFGDVPNVWAAYGYDVVNITALAYKNSLLNQTSLKDELLRIKNYPGVTGKTSFLENGGVEKALRVMQAHDGEFVEFKQ